MMGCGRVLVSKENAMHVLAWSSSDCGRQHAPIAALAPDCRFSSIAQVAALGQFSGRGRLRTVVAHGASFLYSIKHARPLCVVWVDRRASGSVPRGDGALTGLK
jgi:hypothetical protein